MDKRHYLLYQIMNKKIGGEYTNIPYATLRGEAFTDLGVKGGSDWSFRIKVRGRSSIATFPFGARDSYQVNSCGCAIDPPIKNTFCGVGKKAWFQRTVSGMTSESWIEMEADINGFSVRLNGEVVFEGENSDTSPFETRDNMFIGRLLSDARVFVGDIAYIDATNNVAGISMRLLPKIRNSDNAVGFYDENSGMFYVSDSQPYIYDTYVGAPYISVGETPTYMQKNVENLDKNDLSIEMDIRINSFSGVFNIYCSRDASFSNTTSMFMLASSIRWDYGNLNTGLKEFNNRVGEWIKVKQYRDGGEFVIAIEDIIIHRVPIYNFDNSYSLLSLFASQLNGEGYSNYALNDSLNMRSFKMTRQSTGADYINLVPVNQGSTEYSSNPAPYVTMYDRVSGEYMPVSGKFEYYL